MIVRNIPMNPVILAAAIGALATLIVALIAHFSARRREYQLKNLQFKLDRYADFLGGFADIGSDHPTREANMRVAEAINVMNLIASRQVLSHVYELLDYVNSHGSVRGDGQYSVREQDEIVRKIVLAIRRDLGEEAPNLADFRFRAISGGGAPESPRGRAGSA
jgi:hypothetical protein